MKILRSKEAAASVNVKTWPNIIDTGTEIKYIYIAFMTTVERSVSLTWLILCVQMIFPGNGLHTSINPPLQKCWPTWTSVCPPQACWPELRQEMSIHSVVHFAFGKNRYVGSLTGYVLNILFICFFQISHSAINALCRSIKLQCELYSSRQIAICMDPYCGLGFVLWCMSR